MPCIFDFIEMDTFDTIGDDEAQCGADVQIATGLLEYFFAERDMSCFDLDDDKWCVVWVKYHDITSMMFLIPCVIIFT